MSKLNNYCLLCYEAKCTKECGVFNPDRILRSIYCDNVHVIKNSIDDNIPCFDCDGRCQSACPIKINIKGIISSIKPKEDKKEINYDVLKSDFCGIPLENPFLLSG